MPHTLDVPAVHHAWLQAGYLSQHNAGFYCNTAALHATSISLMAQWATSHASTVTRHMLSRKREAGRGCLPAFLACIHLYSTDHVLLYRPITFFFNMLSWWLHVVCKGYCLDAKKASPCAQGLGNKCRLAHCVPFASCTIQPQAHVKGPSCMRPSLHGPMTTPKAPMKTHVHHIRRDRVYQALSCSTAAHGHRGACTTQLHGKLHDVQCMHAAQQPFTHGMVSCMARTSCLAYNTSLRKEVRQATSAV
jgi:hypothetical protein